MTNPTNKEAWSEEFDKFLYDKFGEVKGNETYRWVFCADDLETKHSDILYDCACCLDGGIHGENCGCICHPRIKQIKDFIRSLVKSERQAEREEILGWMEKIVGLKINSVNSSWDVDKTLKDWKALLEKIRLKN